MARVSDAARPSLDPVRADRAPDRRPFRDNPRLILLGILLLLGALVAMLKLADQSTELNPDFRWLVERVCDLGRHVIDRCNLTILTVGPHRDLPEFLARHRIEVVASLPYFLARSTDAQRGDGVFDASIAALRRLNDLGYGRDGTGLALNLVSNPTGAFLPPRQEAAEASCQPE